MTLFTTAKREPIAGALGHTIPGWTGRAIEQRIGAPRQLEPNHLGRTGGRDRPRPPLAGLRGSEDSQLQ